MKVPHDRPSPAPPSVPVKSVIHLSICYSHQIYCASYYFNIKYL